jgi:DNA-binding transcriptional regulator GbsR (MarR family)
MEMTGKKALCDEQLATIERRLANIIANFGYLKGRSAKTSEVMAFIYIRQEVTQQLLRTLTGYSLGTISAALQDLEKMGSVSKHPSPTSREYTYRLAGTPSQVLSQSMIDFQGYLGAISVFLKEIEAKLNQQSLSERQGFSDLKSFLDEMKVLIPAYQHVLQKFQKTRLNSTQKERGATSDQHH